MLQSVVPSPMCSQAELCGTVLWFVKILEKEGRCCSHRPQERSFTHRPSHQFFKMEITLLSGGADDTGRLAAVNENSVPRGTGSQL